MNHASYHRNTDPCLPSDTVSDHHVSVHDPRDDQSSNLEGVDDARRQNGTHHLGGEVEHDRSHHRRNLFLDGVLERDGRGLSGSLGHRSGALDDVVSRSHRSLDGRVEKGLCRFVAA